MAFTGSSPDVEDVLDEEQLAGWMVPMLRRNDIRYIAVDRREVSSDSLRGYYFSRRDSDEGLRPTERQRQVQRSPRHLPRLHQRPDHGLRPRGGAMRGHGDLEAAVGGAALCALLALFLPFDALRLLVGAPLLFFLPGYAITAAVFARGRIERRHFLVFSVGLSLAVLALGALVLNYLPGGIRGGWWALLLFLVVLGACRGAALRRPRRAGAPIAWSLPRVNGAQAGAGSPAAPCSPSPPSSSPSCRSRRPTRSATPRSGSSRWKRAPAPGSGSASAAASATTPPTASWSSSATVKAKRPGSCSWRRGRSRCWNCSRRTPRPPRPPGAGPIPVVATLYKEDSPEPDQPFRQVSTYIDAAGGPG